MINFEEGKCYNGFQLDKIEKIEDIHSIGYLFQHIKSGARFFYVKNEDKNKVFFISFKTPPNNDCGTAHILEHSVLCGSEKYQSKDPFNELAKGSLNTYLNALTYSDKTMYPVASCNSKDFSNLIGVYLDAVFKPNIYKHKEIFMQEGWHYELEDEKSDLIYKGVVYNEMKGALSNPDRILNSCISKSLFTDSIYKYESGGDPEAIINLSEEDFLNFHKKYYHPSNSYIYMYGDIDIEKYMEQIDNEYLSEYDSINVETDILPQKPFLKTVKSESTYPVLKGEGEKGIYVAKSWIVGKSTDTKLSMAFDILSYLLLETNASPLKKAVIDSGLGKDIEGWFDSSSLDMVFSIVVKKANEEKLILIEKVIYDTLKKLLENGIDKKLVQSCIQIWEFLLREEDYGYRPKGLVYGMKMMKSWLHGADPISHLNHLHYFEEIKKESVYGYFENIIRKNLFHNTHSSFVIVKPEEGKQSKIEEFEKLKLAELKSTLTSDQIKKMIEDTKQLKEYQSQQETQEILEQIPLLNINEIEREAEKIESYVTNDFGYDMIVTPLDTNKIEYVQLLFDTRKIPQNFIPYIGLLAEVLGKIDTEKFSYDQLPTEINMNTGGIGLNCSVYNKENNEYMPVFVLTGKVLNKNLNYLFELFRQIVLHSKFENHNHLKNIIKELKSKLEGNLMNSSHSVAAQRGLSYFSKGSHYKELTSGIAFYRFLTDIEQNIDCCIEDLVQKLYMVMELLFTKQNFMIGVALEKQDLDDFKKQSYDFYRRLSNRELEQQSYKFDFSTKSEAFTGASKVQYNVKTANFEKFGYQYSGKMQVLKTIVNLEYLWNKVRVQGGAYGSGCALMRSGNLYTYSYRDPNIVETLDSYNGIAKFLERFTVSDRELSKYIIGSINAFDRPKSNFEKSEIAIGRYFCNITAKQIQNEREELLSVTKKDIRSYSELFYQAMNENNICVIGNEQKINENRNLFQKITSLI